MLDFAIARDAGSAQARALRGLGSVSIDCKDCARAEDYYLRSQELEPDSEAAKDRLQHIAERSGS